MAQSTSQAVGFTFQGDIFTGGALAYSATGRILKQLSDAGIDPYALHALVRLGHVLHISDQQEYKVAAALKKRNESRRGYLVRGLTIGWGFCDPVYEVSKTKGGCSALLLLSAFAAANSTLAAAQAMRELMRLNGCDEPLLPSAATLSHLVGTFAPIMEDSGFLAIQQFIHTTCAQKLSNLLENPYRQGMTKIQKMMEGVGSVQEWAHAAHQLMFTASRGESIYVEAPCMAAWLAAFASSILEMDCTVLYASHTLWRAAGRHGEALIEIAKEEVLTLASDCDRSLIAGGGIIEPYEPCNTRLKLIPSQLDTDDNFLASTYELRNSFQTSISLIPGLTTSMIQDIETGIWRRVRYFSRLIPLSPNPLPLGGLVGDYMSQCRYLGIHGQCPAGDLDFRPSNASDAIRMLPQETLGHLASLSQCCSSAVVCEDPNCLIDKIARIMKGFASTACALALCSVTHPSVRVHKQVLEQTTTAWTNYLEESKVLKQLDILHWDEQDYLQNVLDHLRVLLQGDDAPSTPADTIAISRGSSTVALRILLEPEACSDAGQVIGIYPGRISYEDCLRATVLEPFGRLRRRGRYLKDRTGFAEPSTLAPGIRFRPSELIGQLRPSIACDIDVRDTHLEFFARVVSKSIPDGNGSAKETQTIAFGRLKEAILQLHWARIAPPCRHDIDTPFVVPREHDVFKSIQSGQWTLPSPGSCMFVASYGSQSSSVLVLSVLLQHMVDGYVIAAPDVSIVIQGDSCLNCTFEVAARMCWENGKSSGIVLCKARPHVSSTALALGQH